MKIDGTVLAVKEGRAKNGNNCWSFAIKPEELKQQIWVNSFGKKPDFVCSGSQVVGEVKQANKFWNIVSLDKKADNLTKEQRKVIDGIKIPEPDVEVDSELLHALNDRAAVWELCYEHIKKIVGHVPVDMEVSAVTALFISLDNKRR